MSLFTTLESRFTFSFDRRDGRYALTPSSSPQYPTSAARDEPYVRPRPRSRPSSTSTASSASSSSSSRSYDKYPLPDMREVSPGMLANGQLTDNHPLVVTYLDALARIMPRAPSKASSSSLTSPTAPSGQLPTSPIASFISATVAAPLPPVEVTYWLANHAGIASILTLSNVISQQFQLFPGHTSRLYAVEVPKLSERQKEAILALAALKVLNHPEHPAHFALWGKNILRRTAQVVDSVLQMKPCPIASRVGWIGLPENVWALEGLQSIYIPPAPQVQKKSAGMTLRKRKAALAATAFLSQVADDDAEGQVAQRKRARTTRASQRVKDAAAAQAAEGAPEDSEVPEEDQSTLLFFSTPSQDVAPPPFVMPTAPTLELISRAVKEEYITSSPVLQAIGLMLGLTDSSAVDGMIPPELSSTESAPRRSTRARRKPALPGTPSTPLSTLSTPGTPSFSPSPLPASDKRTRSHSRGSSTAVSDAGYPSEEGTVIDFDGSTLTSGKRKPLDVEEPELVESAPNLFKANKSKSRAPARKRAKVEGSAEPWVVVDAAVPEDAETKFPGADGKEDLPEIAPVPAVKKRRASGGKRKTARRA